MTTRITQLSHESGPSSPRDWLYGRPVKLQVALDVAGIMLSAATFGPWVDPDILLHCVWVVLALEAFLFGLRVSSVRIVLATVFVFVYSALAQGEATPQQAALIDLDLAEWPLMVVISIVVAVMADRLSATSRRYAILYREASGRLLTAQEDERRRLAHDIHDGVGQTMTALTLTLDAAESMLWAGSDAPSVLSRGAVGRAQELAALALEEARDVARRLRPARILETGLVAAIAELAGAVGTPVAVEMDPALVRPGLLPIDTEIEAFRIIQEALSNSARHARADHRWIAAREVAGQLRLEVRDDGIGFNRADAEGAGLGLAGMAERAGAIDGRLTIKSRPRRGTVVTLDIPLPVATLATLKAARRPPSQVGIHA
jgi:signal transduction histidine kinase